MGSGGDAPADSGEANTAAANHPGLASSNDVPATTQPRAPARVAPRISPDAAFRSTRPASGPLPRLRIAPQSFRTKNGLTVIVLPSKRFPVVHAELIVPGGASVESRQQAGLAWLAARVPSLARQSVLRGGGATLAAGGAEATWSLDWNALRFTLKVPRESLDEALAAWVDSLIGPRPDASTLKTAIDRARFAASADAPDPAEVAGRVLAELRFGAEHRYTAPLVGEAESLARLEPEHLLEHLRQQLSPGACTLVVAGDITTAALEPRLDRLLADWKDPSDSKDSSKKSAKRAASDTKRASTGSAKQAASEAEANSRPRIVLVHRPDAKVVLARVVVSLDGAAGAEAGAERLLETLLGGAWGRLDRSLRRSRGFALRVSSQIDERPGARSLLFGADLVPQHAPAALAELLAELARAAAGPLTQREVEGARRARLGQGLLETASSISLAAALSRLLTLGSKPDALTRLSEGIAKASVSEVERIAAKRLDPRQWVLVVVGDRTALEGPLGRLGSVELRDGTGQPLSEKPETTLRDAASDARQAALARR